MDNRIVVTSIVATIDVDRDGNVVPAGFQSDMLDHIASTAVGKDVSIVRGEESSPVGRVIECYREGDHVVAYSEIDADVESLNSMKAKEDDGIFIIPALDVRQWHVEGDTFVYDDAELVAFLIASRPAGDDFTSTLTSVEVVSSWVEAN